jgi:hypothetical protein
MHESGSIPLGRTRYAKKPPAMTGPMKIRENEEVVSPKDLVVG